MDGKISIMQGLYVTVISMGMVFIILFLISFILGSFKNLFKDKGKYVNKEDHHKELALTDEEDEDEKVVVALAASIMAGQGKINPNLNIKSITRIK
ncbi:OadG family protein [Romboutsia lituseburensis]|uniref:OadG family protein n=1 Tax=Romboutsia lituseburensis TaxID=1537 RepID=UPI00215B075A|nr:OadG family protein [Romboutsia lituseburensis]MCR8744778.1 OadG family protein [Romboutsia lituseburensis]